MPVHTPFVSPARCQARKRLRLNKPQPPDACTLAAKRIRRRAAAEQFVRRKTVFPARWFLCHRYEDNASTPMIFLPPDLPSRVTSFQRGHERGECPTRNSKEAICRATSRLHRHPIARKLWPRLRAGRSESVPNQAATTARQPQAQPPAAASATWPRALIRAKSRFGHHR